MGRFGREWIGVRVFVMSVRLSLLLRGRLVLLQGLRSERGIVLILWQELSL